MEFRVAMPTGTVDLDRVRRLLCDVDPAALVDIDPLQPGLRISAQLTTGELAGFLAQAGCALGPLAIQPQPSVCCGGCGG